MVRHFCLISIFFTFIASAHAQLPPVDCGKTTLVFGNGVGTTVSDAGKYAEQMQNRFIGWLNQNPSANINPNDLTDTVVAVNPTDNLIADIIEVGRQEGIAEKNIWKGFYNLLQITSPNFTTVLEFIADVLASAQDTPGVVDAHVARYKELIALGRKVVVVAHSQGNYFANDAVAKLSLSEQEAIAIVAVGSPDTRDKFFVGGPHTRIGDGSLGGIEDDKVIYLASQKRQAKGLDASLIANTSDPYSAFLEMNPYLEVRGVYQTLPDSSRHSFLDAYLYPGSESERVILSRIAASISGIENLNCVAPTPITKRYTVTDLGQWQPTAINDVGQIVGNIVDPSTSQFRAMLWSGGVFTPLGPSDVISSYATDINNSGQAAGWAQILLASRGNPIHAVKFTGSAMIDLDTFDGNSSQAFGINNYGQVVGVAQGYVSYGGNLVFSPGTAFISSAGVMVDIGTATADRSVPAWLGVNSFLTGSYATKINNNGQVIGNTHLIGNGFMSSFIYDPNSNDLYTMISPLLSPSSAERLSYASEFIYSTDINDLGQVVGWTFSSYLYRAFLYQNGAMIDLPVAARQAFAINNNGQIIGYGEGSSGNTGNYQAGMFLYENGNMKFWDELLPENSGWSMSAATGAFDINNNGQIIGVGYFNGEQRAFLLTPDSSVPVP